METNHKADRENVLSKSSANQNNTLDSGTETLSPPSFLLKIGDSKIEEGPESSESIKSNYNFDAPEQPINNGSSNSGISQLKSNGGLQDDTETDNEEKLLQPKFDISASGPPNSKETSNADNISQENILPFQLKSTLFKSSEPEEVIQNKTKDASTNIEPFQLEAKENNTGLPDNLKSGIENMSGFSMDDVNVNYNSDKPAQLNAHAYAQGTNIEVGPGQEKHLPHEAWHVVQQKQGRVQATTQLKGDTPVNDDVGLEKEADKKGAKASTLQLKEFNNRSLVKVNSYSPTIQRYKTMQPHEYQVEKDKTDQARAPFTRNEDDLSVTDRGEGKAPGISWKSHKDDAPPLLVANDNSLAINSLEGEPKEFYAKAGVLTDANQQLEQNGSPIKLKTAGNKVKIGESNELIMIQPIKKEDDDLPGKDEFISLGTNICRDVAQNLLGGAITHIKLGKDDPKIVHARTGDSTVIGGTHELAEQMVNNNLTKEQGVEELGKSSMPTPGKEYGKASQDGGMKEKAKELGVNEFARPSIGEGYTTQSIFDGDSSKTDYAQGDNHDNDFVWGYHYSSVVAESLDKDDQIALENYNRASDIKAAAKTLLDELKRRFADRITDLDLQGSDKDQAGQIMAHLENVKTEAATMYSQMFKALNKPNNMWHFRIVGKGLGQSFHEQMATSDYFVNPMTLAVLNRKISRMPVAFAEGSSDLSSDQKTRLDKMANDIITANTRGIQPKEIKIIGHGSGYKSVGIGAKKKGKKRAEAVRDYLVSKGVDTNILVVSSEGKTEKNSDDFSRNRNVSFEIED